MNQKLLSICIPTRGRIEILKNTLNSIFYSKVNFSDYEVVIYDSSDDDELSVLLASEYNYPNLIYKKGENRGFLNLVSALELGNGFFLKLHNDYTTFIEGGLKDVLKLIKEHQQLKPLIFFSNGSLQIKTIGEYNNFNEFMYSLSYYSSWSTGFSIWKIDFQKQSNLEYSKMFPHTSLLFEQNDNDLFIVDNRIYFSNQDIPKKGGYNLFKTFCYDYLKMVEDCFKIGKINHKTFSHIKMHMYLTFLIPWYYNTKVKNNNFTFDLAGIRQSMSRYYSFEFYFFMVFVSWFIYPIKNTFLRFLKLYELLKNKILDKTSL